MSRLRGVAEDAHHRAHGTNFHQDRSATARKTPLSAISTMHGAVACGGTLPLRMRWRWGSRHGRSAVGAGKPLVLEHPERPRARRPRGILTSSWRCSSPARRRDSRWPTMSLLLPVECLCGGRGGRHIDTVATDSLAYYKGSVQQIPSTAHETLQSRRRNALRACWTQRTRKSPMTMLDAQSACVARSAPCESTNNRSSCGTWGGAPLPYRPRLWQPLLQPESRGVKKDH